MKEDILKYIIAEYIENDDQLSFDSPLFTTGLVDSFSLVSLRSFLEKKYSITISDSDITPETFNTVDKIYEIVQKYQNK